MRAYDLLTSDDGRKRFAQPTAVDQTYLAELLSAAARDSDGLPALQELARHVTAVAPASEAFAQLVEAARVTLPRYFRGGYGAKLTLRDAVAGTPMLGEPGAAEAVRAALLGGLIGTLVADEGLARVLLWAGLDT